VFTFANSDDDIRIDEGETPGDNYSRISSSGSSESVEFRNPLGSLTVNTGGGNDTVSVMQFDTGSGGGTVNFDVMVNGQGGDLQIGSLNAGPEKAVMLTSDGGIFGAGQIVASGLTVTAANDVELHTAIERLTVGLVGPGNIFVTETDGITLDSVETIAGSITVDAGGPIESAQITAGSGGDVTLTAAGSVTAAVSANELAVQSTGEMVLTTAVADLNAEAIATGNIIITEIDDIILNSIETVNGLITVDAGGSIDAAQIVAGSGNDVTLLADDSVTATVTALNLSVQASGDIALTTTAANLYAESLATGNIDILETDTIEISGLRTANGSIAVTAGGTITAALVKSLTDSDANDIVLTTTTGDILGDTIYAGPQGDVTLDAAGLITATVTADELAAQAVGSITLTTTVTRLGAQAAAAGDLNVIETDDVILTNIQAGNGRRPWSNP